MYLIADNAEGIGVGTDLTFAGFPIGRVRRITLRDDGKARISVRVPVDDAKWLRESSVFVLDVPLVGAAKLRAFTANLQDPPLPDRAERPVLRGDTAEEIPRMVASMRTVLESSGPGFRAPRAARRPCAGSPRRCLRAAPGARRGPEAAGPPGWR